MTPSPSTGIAGPPVRDALSAAVEALRAAGCETPRLDAELLVAAALGTDRGQLLLALESPLPPAVSRRLMEWIRRRARREPVAYILGRKGFRRIELLVDRHVLIPRPETELLVELADQLAPDGAAVHEVGTGSGAVALALVDERPDLRISASDASADAIAVALVNRRRIGADIALEVAVDLPSTRHGVDLVVANLPYVRAGEWAGLAPEITSFEPRSALVAGEDGLDAIRGLIASSPAGTLMALEHGSEQGAAVRDLLGDARTVRDLAGFERVTVGRVA